MMQFFGLILIMAGLERVKVFLPCNLSDPASISEKNEP
jgi:hypothetical protein